MLLGHYVVAKARCNRYFRNVNTYFLSKMEELSESVWKDMLIEQGKCSSSVTSVTEWSSKRFPFFLFFSNRPIH
jgi:hypothetical protein